MKKILYTNFQNIDDLICELSEQKEFKRAVTRNNLYKFWEKVAGYKLAQYSRPYSMIKGTIMVVACKTPIVAQELTLKKKRIIDGFQPYLKSLRITLTDIKFDSKKWQD